MLKSPHPTVNLQCQKNTALRVNPWAKLLVVWGLVAIGNILYALPLLAAPPAAGTTIDNKATGTFVDGDDLTNLEQSVESNTVTITVAKVAGITVGAQAPAEAPSTVNGAGPYQNFSGIQTGDVVYFDFIITNTGNDVTQFTIPSTATVTGGGTIGTLQIIGYNNLVFDGLSGNPNPINIPTSFDPIANSTGKLLATTVGANRGSVAVGGTIKVRVPVTISASAGSNVTVLLGNTDEVSTSTQTPKERLQNQAYIDNSSTDVYTLYSTDTGGGNSESADPPANGSREASAIALATVLGKDVSGNVFDDVNYGGGVGRSKGVSGGQGVNGATVELYDSTGKFVRSITTDNLGDYTFPGVPIGDFFVRVVNNTVISSRSATGTGLVPVQTFRTNAATGTITTVTNRVGGEKPAEVDAPANTTATLAALNLVNNQEVQSLTAVKVGSTALTGIDFGYNFDTIVNTNDAGQGSLRQFILNSNALSNTGLAQALPPSITAPNARNGTPVNLGAYETSIFMIPDPNNDLRVTAGTGVGQINLAATAPDGGTGSAFVINLTSANLNDITSAFTSIDGRTQTVNIPTVSNVPKLTGSSVSTGPEVVINSQAAAGAIIQTRTSNTILHSIGVTGSSGLKLGIRSSQNGSQGTGGTKISDLILESTTIFNLNSCGVMLVNADRGVIRNSVIRDTGLDPTEPCDNIQARRGSANALIENNQLLRAGNYGIGLVLTADDALTGESSDRALIRGNVIAGNGVVGTGGQTSGIGVGTSIGTIIENNQINSNVGDGITVTNNTKVSHKIKISQNSIYNNGGLGIDLGAGAAGDSVTPNNGLVSATSLNNGLDYPIITSSTLSGNTLTVKGYVGNLPAGSTTFPTVRVEFFVGATDTNDRGKVFSTDPDTISKIHAEGQTYLGSCNTDANGLFGNVGNTCTLNVPTGTEPLKITSTATDLAGNTSEFSAAIASNPNLLLVKRITAINGGYTTKGGDNDLAIYKNTDSPYDDNVDDTPPFIGQPHPNQEDTTYWPTVNSFLTGGTDGGRIKPNDSIEYTIYFLSAGDTPTNKVLFCDRVPVNVTFMPSAFNNSSITPDPAGLSGIDRGIAINLSGTLKSYTNAGDGDLARYFPPTQDPIYRDYTQFFPGVTDPLFLDKKICDGPNTNGAVVVNLGTIPNATSDGEAGTYGFVRFRGQVK